MQTLPASQKNYFQADAAMKIVSLKNIKTEGVSHDPRIRKQVMIRNGNVPHLTSFSRAVFKPKQKITKHRHADMHEIFLIESGNGVIKINGKNRKISKETCITVEPGEEHEIRNTGSRNLVIIYFGIES